MGYRKLEILSLNRKEIIYKNIKHKKARTILMLAVILIIPILVLGFTKYNGESTLFETIATLGNPMYSPYDDYGGIVFTDSDNYLIADSSELCFELPAKPQNIEVKDSTLFLTITENLVIYSPEKGIVSAIGEQNGVKYIKILHSKNIESIIENVNLCGVKVGNSVKKGQQIATANPNSIVSFKIFENGKQVDDLCFENNKIEWKK